MRIGIGGFQHETNTFAPSSTSWEHFAEKTSEWPGLVSGQALFDAVAGSQTPIAGFIAEMLGHTLLPTTWAAAPSSGYVSQDTYEQISAMILEGLQQALPLDGIYLDLHGAMVAEHIDDGEGELLHRVRLLVGPDIPIIVSLDLHANVTRAMIAHADSLVCYRTYPHIDTFETGQRAAQMLEQRLQGMPRPYVALRSIPYLISLYWQPTDLEPSSSLYQRLREIESLDPSIFLSFATGFPAADFPECSPTVWAYGYTQADADAAADAMERAVLNAEADFSEKLLDPDEAVMRAIAFTQKSTRSVIIADVQDSPESGGSSDTTGILRALIRHHATNTAIGLIVDPAAALAAHQAGKGKTIRIALGGHAGIPDDEPLEAEYSVEHLSNGILPLQEFGYTKLPTMLGLSACLRLEGVLIIVTSLKVLLGSQKIFQFMGVEPYKTSILVLKSTADFRTDFTPITHTTFMCAAPGYLWMDPTRQSWKRLKPGIRLAPCGPTFNKNQIHADKRH